MTELAEALETEFGTRPTGLARVSGGDTAAAFRVEFGDGRVVFAKTHPSPPAGFFSREAADLDWLGRPDELPVPKVLAVSDDAPAFLALEWIEPGRSAVADDAAFGRSLAQLHRAGAPAFGRQDGRTTGSLALPNEPVDTWVEFFAERRLRPLARLAEERAALPPPIVARLDAIASRLDELGGPPEAPARLHGDLWAGNRMVDRSGVSWLIDPAAHGGHREFDLAMMRLFGGFGAAAFSAYDEVHPLADGWERRVALHQLAPLVVHAIKFGGSYVGAVDDALSSIE